MKCLIANVFFFDYELIETDTKQEAVEYIKSKGEKPDGITVLGNSNNITVKEALEQADEKFLFII